MAALASPSQVHSHSRAQARCIRVTIASNMAAMEREVAQGSSRARELHSGVTSGCYRLAHSRGCLRFGRPGLLGHNKIRVWLLIRGPANTSWALGASPLKFDASNFRTIDKSTSKTSKTSKTLIYPCSALIIDLTGMASSLKPLSSNCPRSAAQQPLSGPRC